MDKSHLLREEDVAEVGQGADDRRQHGLVVEWDDGEVEDLQEVGKISDANSVSVRVCHHYHPVPPFQ